MLLEELLESLLIEVRNSLWDLEKQGLLKKEDIELRVRPNNVILKEYNGEPSSSIESHLDDQVISTSLGNSLDLCVSLLQKHLQEL